MKTTLDLPDELLRAVKVRAAEENLKLREVVADLLRLGLAAAAVETRTVRNRASSHLWSARIPQCSLKSLHRSVLRRYWWMERLPILVLCDSNVWLALVLSQHQHHPAAMDWLATVKTPDSVCFCRATQQSLLRLLTTEAVLGRYGTPALTNRQAFELYEQILEERSDCSQDGRTSASRNPLEGVSAARQRKSQGLDGCMSG